MPRGGFRPGAGRKPGSTNIRTREIADRAIQEGITPLEVLLDIMRSTFHRAKLLAAKLETSESNDPGLWAEVMKLRHVAQEAAKDAAPYLHPRLSSVSHPGNDGDEPVEFTFRVAGNEPLSPEELRTETKASAYDRPPGRPLS